MKHKHHPTDAELDLLKVLWEYGPCTVSKIKTLLENRPPSRGYTTILKLLQIMATKKLVNRNQKGRAHVYRAAVSDTLVHRNLVRRLLDRAFDNSASKLVAQALSARPVSSEELIEIRRMLNEIEEGSK